MDGYGWRRCGIAALTAGSLVLGTTSASLAQPTPPGAARTCRMQNADDPRCRPPPNTGPVRVSRTDDVGDRDDGSDDEREDSDGGIGLAEILLGIVAVVLAGLLIKELTGSEDASVDELERDGPRTPEQELLGQYEVQGLLFPGWPLVIEVDADPDATTFVEIVTSDGKDGAIPPMVLSDAGGAPWGGRKVLHPLEIQRTERGILARFELPAELRGRGSGGFHSARFAVASGRMRGDEFVYSPLNVLGIGVGPSAVGSAAVEISRFDPVPEARRADYVVTFNAQRTFTSLRAELVEREQSGGETRRTRIASQDICRPPGLDVCQDLPPSVPFPIAGSWPTDTSEELSAGSTYHMELRAYTGRIRSGGWLVGQAPQVVTWP